MLVIQLTVVDRWYAEVGGTTAVLGNRVGRDLSSKIHEDRNRLPEPAKRVILGPLH